MNMKVWFLRVVGIAVIVLIVLPVLLALFDWPRVPWTEFEIGLYNLVVDLFAGAFTVWGLYWAASELALRPELSLDIEGLDGTHVLKGESQYMYANVVKCMLYLTNARPKAARFVRIVLFVCNVPPLKYFQGKCIHHDGTISVFYPHEEGEGFSSYSVQYPENFVVYKGEGLCAGTIELRWLKGICPKQVRFMADLHSLESEPRAVDISRPIRWAGEVD